MYTRQLLREAKPDKARKIFCEQKYKSPTNGCCDGYLQANVVILEKKYAADFLTFCELNSRPAPLLEVLPAGNPYTKILANNADIRSVLPKYRIHKYDGSFEETYDIKHLWNDNMVTFFLGCSFSFEKALQSNGINMRHIDLKRNVAMYNTNIITNNVNGFGKHMVVSMRPIKKTQILSTYKITEPFSNAHGSPVYFGYPQGIGINNINKPDYGQSIPIKQDELPVFWACGITTQVAVKNALKMGIIDKVITHAPGHMFISDIKIEDSQNINTVCQHTYSKL
eukprot:475613_1